MGFKKVLDEANENMNSKKKILEKCKEEYREFDISEDDINTGFLTISINGVLDFYKLNKDNEHILTLVMSLIAIKNNPTINEDIIKIDQNTLAEYLHQISTRIVSGEIDQEKPIKIATITPKPTPEQMREYIKRKSNSDGK